MRCVSHVRTYAYRDIFASAHPEISVPISLSTHPSSKFFGLVVILRVTQDPALRGVAQDGFNIDTRLAYHQIVNPAQAPKGDLAAGPVK